MVPNGWNALNLKNVAQKIQDGNYGSDYPKADELVASGIPFLTSKVIGGNGTVNRDKFDYISEEKHQKLKKAQITSGDILFTNRGANVGTIAITPDYLSDGNIGPQLTLIRCNEKIEKDFLFQFLRGSFFQKQVRQQDSGSAMNFFGIKDTERFKILVPPRSEQKKIAQILSTWDKAITTTEQLLANSQQQKKALMQQLLVGKKRLLDKNGVRFSGEWIHGRLGDLCTFKGGSAFKEAYQGQSAGELPFIKVSDMNLPGNERSIEYSNNWVSVETAKLMKAKPFPESSIVFAKVGAALLLNRRRILSRPTIIDNNMMAAIPSNVADTEFLYQLLMAIDFARFVQEGAVPSINQGDLSSFKLSYPDVEEQQKIAAALSNADQEIAVLQQKLDALKQEKKALMQQLLTGKRRVQLDDQNTKATTYGN